MMKHLFFGLIIILIVQACTPKMQNTHVNNTKWVLSEWPGKTMPAKARATLNFEGNNRVSGKSFCNGFGGSAMVKGDSVKFDQLIGTMMYCEEVGQAENNFLNDLKSATTLKVSADKLQLLKDGTVILVFAPAK